MTEYTKRQQWQRANLRKLADFLMTSPIEPERFNMGDFFVDKYGRLLSEPQHAGCGAVACAVGWGPVAGIRPYADGGWRYYADRVFGTAVSSASDEWDDDTFDWMFGCDWSDTDNTPVGAAKRIYYFLENGLPSNCRDQMRGDADLVYNTEHLS